MSLNFIINFFSNKNKKHETAINWHEDFIVHLAKELKPKVYLELGLYQCELFNRIIPFSEKLFGVDVSKSAGDFMKKNKKTNFFNGTTNEFANIFKKMDIKIDLLFIDADHSKEAVLKDFENFFPLVADQGIILFHDSFPKNEKYAKADYCGDGYLAIEKLSKNTEEYEMTTIPIHPGLTICRKRNNQLSW